MKLGVFMSDYRTGADVVDRLSADKLGIIFVGNGIYRATLKEGAALTRSCKSPQRFTY